MKKINLIAVSLIFAAMLAVSASAQTGDKIGLVDWGQFADPTKGIKKYSTALKTLDDEFKPINLELQGMGTKYQTLAKEVQNMQEVYQKNPTGSPFSVAAIQAKADELGQMERDIKKKQEDGKAKYQSRSATLLGPISNDIMKAMSDFASQKGYAMILDGAKLAESGILLAFIPKTNITDEFITFFNARTTTATTTTTK